MHDTRTWYSMHMSRLFRHVLRNQGFDKYLTRIIQSLYYAPAGRYINWRLSVDRGRRIIRVNKYLNFMNSKQKHNFSIGIHKEYLKIYWSLISMTLKIFTNYHRHRIKSRNNIWFIYVSDWKGRHNPECL